MRAAVASPVMLGPGTVFLKTPVRPGEEALIFQSQTPHQINFGNL